MPSTPSTGTTGSERTSTRTSSSSSSRTQAIFNEIGKELLDVFDDLVEAVEPLQVELERGEKHPTRHARPTKSVTGPSSAPSKKPGPPTSKALEAHARRQLPAGHELPIASTEAPRDIRTRAIPTNAGSLPLPLRLRKIDDGSKGKDQIAAWLEETDTTVQAPPIPPKSKRRQAPGERKQKHPVKHVRPLQLQHSLPPSRRQKSDTPQKEGLGPTSSQHTVSRTDKPLPPTPTSQYSVDQNDAEPGSGDRDKKYTSHLTSLATEYRTLINETEASTYADTVIETTISYLPPGAPKLAPLPTPSLSPTTPSLFYQPLTPPALFSTKGTGFTSAEASSTSRRQSRSASSAGAPSTWPAPKIQRLLAAVQPQSGAVS